MGSDSISSDLHLPSRKKRTNRLAKLKQSKLDVRREQWLSQLKNKEQHNVDPDGRSESLSPSTQIAKKVDKSLINLEMFTRKEDGEGLRVHECDLESLASSQSGTSFGLNESNKSHGGSSRTSTSSRCDSGCVSEEEGHDSNLDDWEAIADALNAADNHSPNPQYIKNSEMDFRKSPSGGTLDQAWMPHDVSRPQSLPDCGRGVVNWAWKSRMSPPSSCPICCEDLDETDTSFLPCSCGFRLCLFCHNRILEEDGRCPGCRKHYI